MNEESCLIRNLIQWNGNRRHATDTSKETLPDLYELCSGVLVQMSRSYSYLIIL